MSLRDNAENAILDFYFRGQSLTPPATFHVALFTATPSDSAFGTEVSGGSYARVSVAANMTNWSGTQSAGSTTASSGTGGQISNNAAITFPAPTANWGTITHFGLCDHASNTGDSLKCYGALSPSRTVNSGEGAPSFGAGQLTITLG